MVEFLSNEIIGLGIATPPCPMTLPEMVPFCGSIFIVLQLLAEMVTVPDHEETPEQVAVYEYVPIGRIRVANPLTPQVGVPVLKKEVMVAV
jgi:hypothetical protein